MHRRVTEEKGVEKLDARSWDDQGPGAPVSHSARSLIPLDFFLRYGHQYGLARDVPTVTVYVEGLCVAAKESGVAGREWGWRWGGGVDGPAAQRSARARSSGGT